MHAIVKNIFLILIGTLFFFFTWFLWINIGHTNKIITSQKYKTHREQLLKDNESRINAAIALCESTEEDLETFNQKAFNILQEHWNWQRRNHTILKEYPTLARMIDAQWMEAIYQISRSLNKENNAIQKEKKAGAIKLIASQLDQKMLNEYLTRRLEQDKELNEEKGKSEVA